MTVTITWVPKAGTEGVRLRWDVHAPGDAPNFANGGPKDVEATVGETDIEVTWPLGDVLSVEITGWSEFSGGSVAGEEGSPQTFQDIRPGGAHVVDPLGALACRVTFDNEGELVYDDQHCLTLANP